MNHREKPKMKTNSLSILLLGAVLCPLLVGCGCDIPIGDWQRAKHEREITGHAPLAPGSTVVVETKSGSITVVGSDVADCNVTANVTARATTEEEAVQLAEQVKLVLEPVGDTLKVHIDKPAAKRTRSISVSFDITVPKQTSVDCTSAYGPIKLTDLEGDAKGKTRSGSIDAANIQGSTLLETAYGRVTCERISGDSIRLKSSSGDITAENVRGSADFDTAYGSITCRDFSDGDLDLDTKSGKITLINVSAGDCDAHTAYGGIHVEGLSADSVTLDSGSGGIDVTGTSAETTNLSTAYGRIGCRDITTSNLTAKSASGNIEIACAQSAPADMTASGITSYGSIEFAAPPAFSGQVDLATSYGSIKTEIPITIAGELTKKKLSGKIGDGNGKLRLETKSGSVTLRWNKPTDSNLKKL